MKRVLTRLSTGLLALAVVPVWGLVHADAAAAAPAPTVQAFGAAPKYAGPQGDLSAPVVAIAADATRQSGYWSLGADGAVYTSGPSDHHGGPTPNGFAGLAVDIVSTPTGDGYWITTTHGAVYHYGDARWYGSARDETLGKPIVGIAATPSGRGYWLVTGAGRVFAYGDAAHLGNATTLFTPPRIVDIVASPSGDGYALLDASGHVFAFGDAFQPSITRDVVRPAVAIGVTDSGRGYWVLDGNAGIHRYGDATGLGDAEGAHVAGVDLAVTRQGGGYWIATASRFPPVPAASGTGRRIVYSNGQQRIWLIEANGTVSHSFRVSGRTGAPPFGTYSIASKSEMSSAGSLRLPYMSRFYKASSGKWIGFHGIPLRPDGTPIQTDAQLGQPLSHGCVRMNQQDIKVVWAFTPIGTKIVVVP